MTKLMLMLGIMAELANFNPEVTTWGDVRTTVLESMQIVVEESEADVYCYVIDHTEHLGDLYTTSVVKRSE